MRSYHVDSGAGIDGLAVRHHPEPVPGPGQVLVAVHAASLSFRDLMVLRGNYVLPVKPDVVPVADGAGEVVSIGPGVTSVRVGDRVAGAVFPRWQHGPIDVPLLPQLGGSLDGMLTESAVLDASALVPVPDHLSYEEAATLPCAAVTAWNALTGDAGDSVDAPVAADGGDGPGGLRPGQTLLTLGSGGVSLFALQFGKALGARVIATTSSPEKAKRLTELGADAVVDYRAEPDWPSRVRELTDGRGVDRVVDIAGDVDKSLAALRMSGHVACVGFISAAAPPIDPRALFASVATVRAVAVGSRAQFLAMNRAISRHALRPPIDRVFAFDEAPAAFRYYASASPVGKVVVRTRP